MEMIISEICTDKDMYEETIKTVCKIIEEILVAVIISLSNG